MKLKYNFDKQDNIAEPQNRYQEMQDYMFDE